MYPLVEWLVSTDRPHRGPQPHGPLTCGASAQDEGPQWASSQYKQSVLLTWAKELLNYTSHTKGARIWLAEICVPNWNVNSKNHDC